MPDQRSQYGNSFPSNEDVTIDRLVAGGDGLGRLSDGRVVFVPGTIAGERIAVEIVRNKKDLAHGRLISVLSASADRVEPPCPRVAAGCGGCDWQHLSTSAQQRAKVVVAQEALTRTGRLPEIAARLRFGGTVDTAGSGGAHWRTTVRAAVNRSGRAGFYTAGTHDVCACGPCMVAHPVIADVLERGAFSGNDEIVLRVSVSAQQLVVSAQDPRAVRLPTMPAGWSAVLVQTPAGTSTAKGGHGVITEVVDGQTLRVSIGSFFQSGPIAAQLLVDTVRDMLSRFETPDAFLDLYGGVGLFAATIGRAAKTVVVVESASSSADDAMYNLPEPVIVHKSLVEEWEPPRAVRRSRRTHVVADPARAGLGKDGVAVIVGCQPEAIVLVSCDAAAGARDARLLVDAGYSIADVCVLDLFPNTSHIEMVTLFVPTEIASSVP